MEDKRNEDDSGDEWGDDGDDDFDDNYRLIMMDLRWCISPIVYRSRLSRSWILDFTLSAAPLFKAGSREN